MYRHDKTLRDVQGYWLMKAMIDAEAGSIQAGSIPKYSDKVRWYVGFRIPSIILGSKPIPSHTIASPFGFSPMWSFQFHILFLDLVRFFDGYVCTTSLGVSSHRTASFDLGRCFLLSFWRLFTLFPRCKYWISYLHVPILPALLCRRRTVVRCVSLGVSSGVGVTR